MHIRLINQGRTHLQLLDAESDGDKLGGPPYEAIFLNSADVFLKLSHISLVIPRLNIERDNRLLYQHQHEYLRSLVLVFLPSQQAFACQPSSYYTRLDALHGFGLP